MPPAPEVAARPVRPGELPRNAAKLREYAADHGWSSDAWYSRGQGLQLRVVEQVAVRFRRDGHTLVAFWHDGRTVGVVCKDPMLVMNMKEAKAAMAVTPEDYRFELNATPESLREKMVWEYEHCNAYISGHPLDLINRGLFPDVVDIDQVTAVDDQHAPLWDEGDKLQLLGLVEELKLKTTKRRTQMATFTLTDQTGGVRCVAFGEGYKDMANGMLVHVKGTISLRWESGDDAEAVEMREFKVKTAREVSW